MICLAVLVPRCLLSTPPHWPASFAATSTTQSCSSATSHGKTERIAFRSTWYSMADVGHGLRCSAPHIRRAFLRTRGTGMAEAGRQKPCVEQAVGTAQLHHFQLCDHLPAETAAAVLPLPSQANRPEVTDMTRSGYHRWAWTLALWDFKRSLREEPIVIWKSSSLFATLLPIK